jgi:hypothetical protein
MFSLFDPQHVLDGGAAALSANLNGGAEGAIQEHDNEGAADMNRRV